jgi:uncharacterized protein YndB with AHSA1/START domain
MTVALNTAAPIRKSVRVAVPPQRAFEVFTARMGTWWRPEHSMLKSAREDVIVEPRQGGRWYERAVDGTEYNFGHVITWEPPGRLVLAWQLDGTWQYNAQLITEVELRFIADGANGTRVEFEHRNMERFAELTEATRAALDSDGGWTGSLAAFVAATQN